AHDGDGEDARHASPVGGHRGEPEDLIVGEEDGLADAIFDAAGFALEPRAHERQRGFRGLLAGRLTADAVDDDEDAAERVVVVAIFVDLALEAGVARTGGAERRTNLHRGHPSAAALTG